MKNIAIKLTLTASCWILALQAEASTCSCAGVPILGTMELARPNSGQWYLGATYEYHDVSDLVSGSDTIPDRTGRERTSEALVFELSKGITEKWSFSALLAAVEHNRSVGGIDDKASGLGDAILMAKYTPVNISLYSKNALTFGIGARLPVGEDNATRNGVTLAEDMQPSTGAYGGIIWAYAARALNESRGARIYGNISYAENGENDREYKFGREFMLTAGGSYQTGTPWGFSMELLYRNAERDERSGVTIPNTGGEWLDVVPAIQYHVTPTFALGLSGKIPLRRELNDALQFTTKYSVRLKVSYVFGN